MENEKSVPPDMSDFQPEMQIICFLPMFTLLLSDWLSVLLLPKMHVDVFFLATVNQNFISFVNFTFSQLAVYVICILSHLNSRDFTFFSFFISYYSHVVTFAHVVFPPLLESPVFFSWKFQDLQSPGKSLWSWKVLEIKA